jgi:hypothetical protein
VLLGLLSLCTAGSQPSTITEVINGAQSIKILKNATSVNLTTRVIGILAFVKIFLIPLIFLHKHDLR